MSAHPGSADDGQRALRSETVVSESILATVADEWQGR